MIGTPTKAELARRFDVSRSAVTQWSRRHRGLIEQVRASIDTEFAGIYLSSKLTRLWAMQQDYEPPRSPSRAAWLPHG